MAKTFATVEQAKRGNCLFINPIQAGGGGGGGATGFFLAVLKWLAVR